MWNLKLSSLSKCQYHDKSSKRDLCWPVREMGSETDELGECWKQEGDVTEQLWRQQIRCERLFTFQTIELNSFQTDYKLILF